MRLWPALFSPTTINYKPIETDTLLINAARPLTKVTSPCPQRPPGRQEGAAARSFRPLAQGRVRLERAVGPELHERGRAVQIRKVCGFADPAQRRLPARRPRPSPTRPARSPSRRPRPAKRSPSQRPRKSWPRRRRSGDPGEEDGAERQVGPAAGGRAGAVQGALEPRRNCRNWPASFGNSPTPWRSRRPAAGRRRRTNTVGRSTTIHMAQYRDTQCPYFLRTTL